jgi:hypothetical protein
MNKLLKFFTLTALICLPLSSQAWWGPYGGNPYWGGNPYGGNPYWGYAPVYATPYPVAPYYPAYTSPAYPVYGAPWTRYAPPAPVQGPVQAPWGYPDETANDRFAPPADMQATIKRSEAERKQAQQLSATRRAAFQERMKAQRAAIKAQREAWRQHMNKYAPPMATAMQPMQTMPQVQTQAAQPKVDKLDQPQAAPTELPTTTSDNATQ